MPSRTPKDFEPSRMYIYVRSRQLENTYPGDPQTGTWPITAMRICRGWGAPPDSAWPYDGRASAWPPREPWGVDDLAKDFRIDVYQRARTVEECKAVLASRNTVAATLEITDQWYKAPKGNIAMPTPRDKKVGFHCIHLVGYDNAPGHFIFANSWGTSWGDKGYGYIPYNVFNATWVEGWWVPIFDKQPNSERASGIKLQWWGAGSPESGMVHCCEIVGPEDERIGWAFALQRDGAIEVEELFVKPQMRRKGYGTQMAQYMRDVALALNLEFKIWISYADIGPRPFFLVKKLARKFGLRIDPSGSLQS